MKQRSPKQRSPRHVPKTPNIRIRKRRGIHDTIGLRKAEQLQRRERARNTIDVLTSDQDPEVSLLRKGATEAEVAEIASDREKREQRDLAERIAEHDAENKARVTRYSRNAGKADTLLDPTTYSRLEPAKLVGTQTMKFRIRCAFCGLDRDTTVNELNTLDNLGRYMLCSCTKSRNNVREMFKHLPEGYEMDGDPRTKHANKMTVTCPAGHVSHPTVNTFMAKAKADGGMYTCKRCAGTDGRFN